MIIFLSYATCGLWIKHASTKMIQGFLLPGAIVHELSHALLCLVTGTTIKELNLFTSNSTGIKYDKPKIPFLFDFFIAAAPLFGCAFFIVFISKILSNPVHLNSTFPQEIHFTLKGLFDVIRHLLDAVWITFNTFRNQFRITDMRHIFFLLALIIFTVSMSPHKQDIKHLVLGFGTISAILFFLEKLGIHLQHHRRWNCCSSAFSVWPDRTAHGLCTLLFITLII